MTNLISELTYFNYAHNRRIAPHVTPERWAKIFPQAEELEARYQREQIYEIVSMPLVGALSVEAQQ